MTSSTRKHKSTCEAAGVSFCLSAEHSVCFVSCYPPFLCKLCVPPCKRYITSGDTHRMCVVCLGAEHAMSTLEGADCSHCELLPLRVFRSRKALFEEGAFTSVPQGAGPTSAEAERALHSWGSQMDLLEGMEMGDPLSPSLPGRSAARSEGSEARTAATSSQGMGSSLHLSSSEEGDLESTAEEASPQSVQYEELLEVVTRAVAKLNIDWPAEEKAALQRSKLDERFLRSKPPSPRRSLPFFPDLHKEIVRSWERPYSARLFVPASDYYGNVAGLDERAYKAMPRAEQTLASYLSPGAASSLKAPTLPSKPLRTTSSLVGKGYSAAGQAGACLHTMSLLQAYQADLLKGLADGEKVDLEELQWGGLWQPLWRRRGTYEKDRVFLLDAPLEPSGLFGDAVNSVASRYQEAHKQAAAFQRYLPRRSLTSAAAGREQPQPSTSSSYREARTAEGSPYRGRAGSTALHGVHLSSVPSGGQSAVPASATGHNGLRLSRISPPGLVAEPGRSSPPRGSLEQLVRQSPAGPPLEGSELAVQQTPEASLERLVPLVDYLAAWKLLPNVSAWVLRTVEKGYAIQFGAPPPPFDRVFPTLVGPEQALVMEQEVETLLRKEAIEVVPPQDRESGFYSRYFIVPKKDGGLRPIIDLHRLNRSEVPEVRFQGRSLLVSGSSLRPSTLTPHVYEMRRCCISPSSTSRHLHTELHRRLADPSRRTTYLGVVWDSTTMQARLSPARIESILAAVKRVKEGQSLTVKQFQQLLGLMAAASNVIPFGLLYMRPLQWWLKTKGFSLRGNPLRMIKVTRRGATCLRYVEETVVPKSGPGIGSSLSPRHASDRCIPHRMGGRS
ncbi:2-oxoisovalerate dehydrogenase subunit beta, mitochondrial [Labeo rohita]|uniref:2-oxoisovalerate dehydrogenase subunit beta, mitochondrial n=1 Tax=Labeo rohita TaxID=84645 RepID=A0ABQ8MH81_LABRO|nr:2-oxoisovalerate dehydrogenase subunit beta, mitochondrial [Labeo rohita]